LINYMHALLRISWVVVNNNDPSFSFFPSSTSTRTRMFSISIIRRRQNRISWPQSIIRRAIRWHTVRIFPSGSTKPKPRRGRYVVKSPWGVPVPCAVPVPYVLCKFPFARRCFPPFLQYQNHAPQDTPGVATDLFHPLHGPYHAPRTHARLTRRVVDRISGEDGVRARG